MISLCHKINIFVCRKIKIFVCQKIEIFFFKPVPWSLRFEICDRFLQLGFSLFRVLFERGLVEVSSFFDLGSGPKSICLISL